MTDIQPQAKPIWTRCKGISGQTNGCGQRVYNDPIDIQRHLKYCPADTDRTINSLTDRLEKFSKRLDAIENSEPTIDLDAVADWDEGAASVRDDYDDQDEDDTVSRPTVNGDALNGYFGAPGTV